MQSEDKDLEEIDLQDDGQNDDAGDSVDDNHNDGTDDSEVLVSGDEESGDGEPFMSNGDDDDIGGISDEDAEDVEAEIEAEELLEKAAMLQGKDILSDTVTIGGEEVSIEDIIVNAFTESELTCDEWNALSADDCTELLILAAEKMAADDLGDIEGSETPSPGDGCLVSHVTGSGIKKDYLYTVKRLVVSTKWVAAPVVDGLHIEEHDEEQEVLICVCQNSGSGAEVPLLAINCKPLD